MAGSQTEEREARLEGRENKEEKKCRLEREEKDREMPGASQAVTSQTYRMKGKKPQTKCR